MAKGEISAHRVPGRRHRARPALLRGRRRLGVLAGRRDSPDYFMFRNGEGSGGAIGKRGESTGQQVRIYITVDSLEARLRGGRGERRDGRRAARRHRRRHGLVRGRPRHRGVPRSGLCAGTRRLTGTARAGRGARPTMRRAPRRLPRPRQRRPLRGRRRARPRRGPARRRGADPRAGLEPRVVGAGPRARRSLPVARRRRRASIPTTPTRRPTPTGRRSRRWARDERVRRDRGDRARLGPDVLALGRPARQPAPQPRPRARDRQARDPPLPVEGGRARRPGRALDGAASGRVRRRGGAARRSASGRRR